MDLSTDPVTSLIYRLSRLESHCRLDDCRGRRNAAKRRPSKQRASNLANPRLRRQFALEVLTRAHKNALSECQSRCCVPSVPPSPLPSVQLSRLSSHHFAYLTLPPFLTLSLSNLVSSLIAVLSSVQATTTQTEIN